MIKQLIPTEPQQCPVQMPVSYFGASYPDSQCIEGYLWDEDSGDDEGFTSGGDIPCPYCNPADHADYMKKHDGDEFVCDVCDTKLEKLHWAETEKPSVKLYGYCPKCGCNQWAGYKEAKAQAMAEVLKKFCNEHKDPAWRGRLTEYDKGYSDCCIAVLEMIEAQEPAND